MKEEIYSGLLANAGQVAATAILVIGVGASNLSLAQAGGNGTANAGSEVVNISDRNIRAEILDMLGKSSGDITVADMESLTVLDVGWGDRGVSNLSGLEKAVNLTELYLRDSWPPSSQYSDLSPLAGLTNLKVLSLLGNTITDFGPLAGLINLIEFQFEGEAISDLSPLAGWTNLKRLVLYCPRVSDFSPLAGLTNLTELYLGGDAISNLSPLAGLANLKWLSLGSDAITDIQSLAGLANLTELDLWGSEISDLSPLGGLTNLTVLQLGDISDLSSLAGLPNLRELSVRGEEIGGLSSLVGLPSLRELSVMVDTASNLSPLTGLTNLTGLSVWGNAISDLSPLAGLVNLRELGVGGNTINNLSPLAGLTNLRKLNVWSHAISDLSPLAGLTNLTELYLDTYLVSDFSPLAGLTNLTDLSLTSFGKMGGGALSDLSPLAEMTNLTVLKLSGNHVRDLSPLAGLTSLTDLLFAWNDISDLSPLAGLTNLTWIGLYGNEVSDLTPLAGLVKLKGLDLEENKISDLRPLAGLINLSWLALTNNSISDLTPLADLTNLEWLDLRRNEIFDLRPLAGLTHLRDGVSVPHWEGSRGFSDSGLALRDNYIDITPDSPERQVIDTLHSIKGLTVEFLPQEGVKYRTAQVEIVKPPQSLTTLPGSTVTLSVTTGGLDGESYEWKHGDIVIGENSPTLTLSDVQATHSGQYTVTVTANGQSVSSRAVTLGVKAPPYDNGRLLNISTRGQILEGSKIMIAGFVVEGTGEKNMLIRGIGPGLGQWVDCVCSDPRLELFRVGDEESNPMAANEVWGADSDGIPGICQKVGAFALEEGSKDAALHLALEPGAYTAKVTDLEGTGLGLVELYDADSDPQASTCHVVNISTRGEVGTESRILIAGFVVAGDVPKQVLIRGVGPGLVDFGVGDALVNPVLTLYKAADPEPLWVATNNNWSDNSNAVDIVAASTAAGAFDLVSGSKDAAILTWLEPGSYTAQVSGIGITTGVALVEVYEVN